MCVSALLQALRHTNIRLDAYVTTLVAFVTVHITCHVTHCNLYRLAINGLKDSLLDQILETRYS